MIIYRLLNVIVDLVSATYISISCNSNNVTMSIVLGSNNTSIVRRSVPGIILHIIDLYSPVPQGYTFQSNVEQDNTRVKFSANAKREESWKKPTINHQLNTQKPHREQRNLQLNTVRFQENWILNSAVSPQLGGHPQRHTPLPTTIALR